MVSKWSSWVSGVPESMRPLRARVQEGGGRSVARGGSMLALARSGNELPAARRSISRRSMPQGAPSLPHRPGAPGELARCSRVPCASAPRAGGGQNGVSLYQPLRVRIQMRETIGSGCEKSRTKRVDKGSRQKKDGGSAARDRRNSTLSRGRGRRSRSDAREDRLGADIALL